MSTDLERLKSRMMVESVRGNVRVALEHDRGSMQINPAVMLAWLEWFDAQLNRPTLPADESQRFTAKVAGRYVTFYDGGDFYGTYKLGVRGPDIAAQLNRPALPDDDLPEGVCIMDGRLWLLPEANLPAGWDWRNATGQWGDPNLTSAPRAYPCEVRRPTPPAVERVPWWGALGRRSSHNCRPITVAEHNGERVVLRCATTDPSWHPDADGTVEVLRQDGAE